MIEMLQTRERDYYYLVTSGIQTERLGPYCVGFAHVREGNRGRRQKARRWRGRDCKADDVRHGWRNEGGKRMR